MAQTPKPLTLTEMQELVSELMHLPEVTKLTEAIHAHYRPWLYTGKNMDMSCWWGAIHDREQHKSPMMRSLYYFHEYSHMTINGMNNTNPTMFGAVFDDSERYASFMSEVWIYLKDPTLVEQTNFPGPMLWEFFADIGVKHTDIRSGVAYRSRIVDGLISLPDKYASETARLTKYSGNIGWATKLRTHTPTILINPLGSAPSQYMSDSFKNPDSPPTGNKTMEHNVAIMREAGWLA